MLERVVYIVFMYWKKRSSKTIKENQMSRKNDHFVGRKQNEAIVHICSKTIWFLNDDTEVHWPM